MSGTRFAGSWLFGLGMGMVVVALARGAYGNLAFPFFLGAAGFVLLTNSRQRTHRFPDTDLERGLNRLLVLLFPAATKSPNASVRGLVNQQLRLAALKRAARRWAKELQLIATDGYETVSRISASRPAGSEQDDRELVVEAVSELSAERARAGVDLPGGEDPLSMLAYGLGARPAGANLVSLDELLGDLGLAGEDDELRAHFDDVIAGEATSTTLRLRTDTERTMFRDLAGASFVLGASRRILELATSSAAGASTLRPSTAGLS